MIYNFVKFKYIDIDEIDIEIINSNQKLMAIKWTHPAQFNGMLMNFVHHSLELKSY